MTIGINEQNRNSIQQCANNLRKSAEDLGITLEELRLGIRVATHGVNPEVATSDAIKAGAIAKSSYSHFILEHAMIIVFSQS